MPIVNLNLVSGVPPFKVELIGSDIEPQYYYTFGIHSIDDVPEGVYILNIKDANECEYEQELIVNPAITTTTTTVLPGDSIIVGHSQDPLTIFNPNATNRNSQYNGYPDPDVVNLFLWFKTKNGALNPSLKTISYSINSSGGTAESIFSFDSVSDEVHTDVQESTFGTTAPLNGNLILKKNFIETYFQYICNKAGADTRFQITLNSTVDLFDTNILTRQEQGKTYGINYIDRRQIKLNY